MVVLLAYWVIYKKDIVASIHSTSSVYLYL